LLYFSIALTFSAFTVSKLLKSISWSYKESERLD
jgi:hypothetical protein